jgi:hypothetical protein
MSCPRRREVNRPLILLFWGYFRSQLWRDAGASILRPREAARLAPSERLSERGMSDDDILLNGGMFFDGLSAFLQSL